MKVTFLVAQQIFNEQMNEIKCDFVLCERVEFNRFSSCSQILNNGTLILCNIHWVKSIES